MRKPEQSLNNDYLTVFDLESKAVEEQLKHYEFYHLIISGGYSDFNDTSILKKYSNKITQLTIRSNINDVKGLYELDNLEWIRFAEANDMFPKEVVFQFGGFKKLKRVTIEYWGKWSRDLYQAEGVNDLFLSYYQGDLKEINQLKSLVRLKLSQCKLSNLSTLSHLDCLEILELYSIRKLTDLSDLANLKSLKKIALESIGATDISVLGRIATLEDITLCKKYNFENFDLFSELQNLRILSLYGQVEQHNLGAILALKHMEKLTLIKQKTFNLLADEVIKLADQYGRKVEVEIFGSKKSPTVVIYFKDSVVAKQIHYG